MTVPIKIRMALPCCLPIDMTRCRQRHGVFSQGVSGNATNRECRHCRERWFSVQRRRNFNTFLQLCCTSPDQEYPIQAVRLFADSCVVITWRRATMPELLRLAPEENLRILNGVFLIARGIYFYFSGRGILRSARVSIARLTASISRRV